MTTATFDFTRTTTSAVPSSLGATSSRPVRRSLVVRWLVAMLELAQVRGADHPEFAEYVTA